MGKQMRSIEELRRELANREAELAPLQAKREKLAKELDAVDRQIATLTGEAAPAWGRRKRRGGKKAEAVAQKGKRGRAKKSGKRGGRRTGEKPLAERIVEVLQGRSEGMSIKDIAEAVKAAGYKTTSKNFSAVVTLTLTKDKRFKKVSRGVYKLA